MQTISEIQKHINALTCKSEVSEYDDENMNIHSAELNDHRRWWIDHLEKHKNSIRSVNLYTNDSMTKYSYPHGELLKTCQVGDIRVDPVSIRAIDILIYQLVLLMLTRFGQEAKQGRLCLTHSVREKLLYVFNSREYVKILNRLGMVGKLQIFCDNQNDDDKMVDIQIKGRVYQYPTNLGLKYCFDKTEQYGIMEEVIPVVILFVFLDFPHLSPARCLHSHDFWKMVAMVCRVPLCTLFMQTIHTESLKWQPFLENYSEQFVISCLKGTLDFGDICAWPAFASTKLSRENLAIPTDTTDEAFVTYALMKPIATQMFHLVAQHQMNCLNLCFKQYKTLRNEYSSRKLFKYNGEHMPSKTNECKSLENSERHEEHLTDVPNPSDNVKLSGDKNMTNELESKSTSHERHAALMSMDNSVVQHIHSEETNDTIKIEIDIDDVQTEIDPEQPQMQKSQNLTEDQFEIQHPEIESRSLTKNQFEIEHYMNDMQTDIDIEHLKTKSEDFTEDEFKIEIDVDDVQNEINSEQCELKCQNLTEQPIKIEIDKDDVPYEIGMEKDGIRSQSLTELPIKIEIDMDDVQNDSNSEQCELEHQNLSEQPIKIEIDKDDVPDIVDDDFDYTMANNVTKNLKRKYEGGVFNETEEHVGDMKGYSKARKVDYDARTSSTVDTCTKPPHSVKTIKESFVLLERNAVAEALVLECRPSRIKKEMEENLTEQHQSTCNISKLNSVQCLNLNCSDNGSNGKLDENKQTNNCNEIFVEILKVSNSETENKISTSSVKTENKNSPFNPETVHSNCNPSPKKSLRPRKQKVCYYESDSEAVDENSDNEMSLVIDTDDSDSNDPNYNDLDDGLDSDSEGSDDVKGNADAAYKQKPVANACASIRPSVSQGSSDLSTSSGNIPVFLSPLKETSATNTSHDPMNNVKAKLWDKIKSAVSSRESPKEPGALGSPKLCIDSKLLSTGQSPKLKATCGPTIYIPSTSANIQPTDMSQSDKVPINNQLNNVDHIPQSDMSQSDKVPINNQLNNVDHIPQSDMSQSDKVPINNQLNNVDHIPQSDMSQSDQVPINNQLNNVNQIPPGNDEVNTDATYKQHLLSNVCASISPSVSQGYVSLCKVTSEPVRNLNPPATASSAVHALYEKIKSEPCNIFMLRSDNSSDLSSSSGNSPVLLSTRKEKPATNTSVTLSSVKEKSVLEGASFAPSQQIVRPPRPPVGLKPLAPKNVPPSQQIVRHRCSLLGVKPLAPKYVSSSQQIVRPPRSALGLKPFARKNVSRSKQIVRPPRSPLDLKPLAPKNVPPSLQIVRHPRSLLGLKPLAPKNEPLSQQIVKPPPSSLGLKPLAPKNVKNVPIGIPQTEQNPGIPLTVQNLDINKTEKDFDIPQVTQNSGIPQVIQNSGIPKVTQNSGIPKVTQNSGISQVTQNSGKPQVTQNFGIPKVTQNSGIPKVTQNSGIPKVTQNSGISKVTQNSGISKVTQNSGISKVTQNSGKQQTAYNPRITQIFQTPYGIVVVFGSLTEEAQIGFIDLVKNLFIMGQKAQNSTGLRLTVQNQTNILQSVQNLTGVTKPIKISQPAKILPRTLLLAQNSFTGSVPKKAQNSTDVSQIAQNSTSEPQMDSNQISLIEFMSKSSVSGQIPAIVIDGQLNLPEGIFYAQIAIMSTFKMILIPFHDQSTTGHINTTSQPPLLSTSVSSVTKADSVYSTAKGIANQDILSIAMSEINKDNIYSTEMARSKIVSSAVTTSHDICINEPQPVRIKQEPGLETTSAGSLYESSDKHSHVISVVSSSYDPINNVKVMVWDKIKSAVNSRDSPKEPGSPMNIVKAKLCDKIKRAVSSKDTPKEPGALGSPKLCIDSKLLSTGQSPKLKATCGPTIYIPPTNGDHIPPTDMSQSDQTPINNHLNNVDLIPQSDMSQSDQTPIINQLNNVDHIPQSDMSQSDKVPINNQLNNIDHIPQSDMSQSAQTPINYLCMSEEEDDDDITIISLKMEPDEPTE